MTSMADHLKRKQEFLVAASAEEEQKKRAAAEAAKERPICNDCGEYESDCVCDKCKDCGNLRANCDCEESDGCTCGEECTQKTSDTPKVKTSPNIPYGLKEQTPRWVEKQRVYSADPKLTDPYYDVKAKILVMSTSKLRDFLNEASLATKSKTLQNILALLETEMFTSSDLDDHVKEVAGRSINRLVAGLWTSIVTNRV